MRNRLSAMPQSRSSASNGHGHFTSNLNTRPQLYRLNKIGEDRVSVVKQIEATKHILTNMNGRDRTNL